ncbi:T9SS type A sorting domain-containing protein [Labilibacter sediminis]|nr:T9SS type A sorting domain-containing protein [Labilibacter sediminis]
MRILITFIIFTFLGITVNGQRQTNEKPLSMQGNLQGLKSSLAQKHLKVLDIAHELEHDMAFEIDNRYGVYEEVDIDIKTMGTLSSVKDIPGQENGTLYRYQVSAPNCFSLSLLFGKYHIPEGAKVFVYTPGYTTVLGAFTNQNNKGGGILPIADISADELIIEYFEPDHVEFAGELVLKSVGKAYRELDQAFQEKSQENGLVDINCNEGKDYQLEKHAVARMTYEVGGEAYLCTGALINNTNNDGTPYFLTAAHCISSFSEAQTLITYFKYENETCGGIVGGYKTIAGSELLATNTDSDFTLLELDEQPDATYQPYFAGWDATENLTTGSFGIHHPQGLPKKVSIGFDTPVSFSYGIDWAADGSAFAPADSHWEVWWDIGKTEGGSSGSPMFDTNGRVIGQLHGGDYFSDLYGKFSYSFDNNSAVDKQLKHWLVKDGSDTRQLDGYFPPDNEIQANFYVNEQTICVGADITLQNKSNFGANQYTWEITPTDFEFIDGTDANSENPRVRFTARGNFDITLTATDGVRTDVIFKDNAVRTKPIIYLNIDEVLTNYIQLGGTGVLKTSGFETVSWSVTDPALADMFEFSYEDFGRTLMNLKEGATPSGYMNVPLQVTASQASCAATENTQLIIPFNDLLDGAQAINTGSIYGPYSNVFASPSENEPYPNVGDCTSELSWCDCSFIPFIVDNSLWYSFEAPSTGNVRIETSGMDTQIALYEAESTEDIMSGDESRYNILAANDDVQLRSDGSSVIGKTSVVPGRTYYVQVDGSGCGAQGEFNIQVIEEAATSIYDHSSYNLSIFPNPFKNEINVESDVEIAQIEVYGMDGLKVFNQPVNAFRQTVSLADIAGGNYVLVVKYANGNTDRELIQKF